MDPTTPTRNSFSSAFHVMAFISFALMVAMGALVILFLGPQKNSKEKVPC
jgi:hypothetical protein